jgi:hypothetical protein
MNSFGVGRYGRLLELGTVDTGRFFLGGLFIGWGTLGLLEDDGDDDDRV